MSDRDWVNRFSSDVDHLLQTGMLADPTGQISDEYSEVLSVAQTLSSIDFSLESKERHALRHRLLARMGTQEGWSLKLKQSVFMKILINKHGTMPVLSIVVLVGLLGILFTNLVWPGSVAVAAQTAVSFVQHLRVGEYTSLDPITPDQVIQMENGHLTMQHEYPSESGIARTIPKYESGLTVVLENRKFNTLGEAQAIIPFPLAKPGYLPDDYAFSHVRVFGEGVLASVNLHYLGPGGNLMLSQRIVGERLGQTVSIGLPDDYVIETVYMNGQFATWAEHVLVWEADGVSYLLSSPDLNLTEAIKIAESLE